MKDAWKRLKILFTHVTCSFYISTQQFPNEILI